MYQMSTEPSEQERINERSSVETAIEYLAQGQIDMRQDARSMSTKIDRVLYAVLGVGGAILTALVMGIAGWLF